MKVYKFSFQIGHVLDVIGGEAKLKVRWLDGSIGTVGICTVDCPLPEEDEYEIGDGDEVSDASEVSDDDWITTTEEEEEAEDDQAEPGAEGQAEPKETSETPTTPKSRLEAAQELFQSAEKISADLRTVLCLKARILMMKEMESLARRIIAQISEKAPHLMARLDPNGIYGEMRSIRRFYNSQQIRKQTPSPEILRRFFAENEEFWSHFKAQVDLASQLIAAGPDADAALYRQYGALSLRTLKFGFQIVQSAEPPTIRSLLHHDLALTQTLTLCYGLIDCLAADRQRVFDSQSPDRPGASAEMAKSVNGWLTGTINDHQLLSGMEQFGIGAEIAGFLSIDYAEVGGSLDGMTNAGDDAKNGKLLFSHIYKFQTVY